MSRKVMGMLVKGDRETKPHACAEVHFTKGEPVDAAPIRCTCGWSGVVGEWRGHCPSGFVLYADRREWGDMPVMWVSRVLEVAA